MPPSAPPPYGGLPAYQGGTFGGQAAGTPSRGMAIAAMVLGIVGIVLCFVFVSSILAIVFGLIALRRVTRAPGEYGGRGMARAGLITGIVGLLAGVGFWIYAVNKAADKTNLDAIKVGDCVKVPTGTIFFGVTTQPCDKPHEGEVFGAQQFDTPGPFPGDPEVSQQVGTTCAALFAQYVGTSVNTSELSMTFIRPTKAVWNASASTQIICIAISSDGSKLTDTVKDSNR